MVDLRCSKCGSNEGFLIETSGGKTIEIRHSLSQDRIKASVRVTCTYCNNHWDHVPITLHDPRLQDPFRRKVMH